MLNRNSILSLDDLPRERVEVPEWAAAGGYVYVRSLTGAERDQVERMAVSDTVSKAAIVAMVAVDENGEQLFTKDDIPALEKKNGTALLRIVNAAFRLNFLSDDEAKKD